MTVRFRSVGTRKSDAIIYSCDLPKIRRKKGEKGQSVNIKRMLNAKNARTNFRIILVEHEMQFELFELFQSRY